MDSTSLTLLDAVKASADSPAWDRFVRLYRPMLIGWARRNQFQDSDAEDLSQEVLRQLTTDLPRYQRHPGRTFRGWLFTIARHTASRYRQRPATRRLPAGEGLSDVEECAPITEMEEQEYMRELSRRALASIRGDFTEHTMAAFTRTKVDGMPASAVAAELGMTAGAVYLAVNRVMTRLRSELDGLLD